MRSFVMNLGTFTDYYQYKMKNNLFKRKRINSIVDYFKEEHNRTVNFTSADDCYSFICHFIADKENEEEILDQLYSVIEHYIYSSQNIYFISDFNTSFRITRLFRNLRSLLGNPLEYQDFTFNLVNELKFDETEETIQFELNFEEVLYDFESEDTKRKCVGNIKVTFDSKNKKFISFGSSYDKSHKAICDCFSEKGYNIYPVYVLKRAITVKNKNFTDFSALTLLVINLLIKTIPSMNYDELTLDSINFTNHESTDIQRMSLNGTNLLNALEVLQRIHSGDTVHTFKMTLGKIIKHDDDSETYYGTSIKVDLSGRLSFVFGDEDINEAKNREICTELNNTIIDLIYGENTVSDGISLINDHLPKPKNFNDMVSIIKDDILKLIVNREDQIAVEKYFIEKHALI